MAPYRTSLSGNGCHRERGLKKTRQIADTAIRLGLTKNSEMVLLLASPRRRFFLGICKFANMIGDESDSSSISWRGHNCHQLRVITACRRPLFSASGETTQRTVALPPVSLRLGYDALTTSAINGVHSA